MKNIKTILIVALSIITIFMATDFFEFEKPNKASQYPPSVDFKAAVNEVLDEALSDRIINLSWDKVFPYITHFETLGTRHTNTGSVGSATTLDSTGLVMETGATLNNNRAVALNTDNNQFLSFDRKSRLRTVFAIESLIQLDNQTTYILTHRESGANIDAYGFKISGNSLLGLAMNAGTETTVSLGTLANNTFTKLEARYSPRDKIVFYVDEAEKGVLTTGLPSPAGAPEALYYFDIKTTEAETKILTIQMFELFVEKVKL